MPQCSFHPNVETELTCTECGRPICPKEMVDTPVGYKCPICAKQPRSALVHLKPKQVAGALGFGAGAGIFGALVLGAFGGGFFGLILGFMWGGLTAEAVHRGSGGHQGGMVNAIAIGAILVGALVSWGVSAVTGIHGLGLFTLAAGAFGAVGDSAAWRMRR